ncbi:MAG: NeuD/PglB/VioB family sugar acetyltransferase [Woeseiaceae bacterium]|nr:NeuD/PglB/VioB family sugar acetyltransferase [Woeseiaceae bacterium]
MSGKLIVIGAGGHGVVIAEAATAANEWKEVVFLDDRQPTGSIVNGFSVVGRTTDMQEIYDPNDNFVVGIGDNHVRLEVHSNLVKSGFVAGRVIHPSAVISPTASIGHGTVVLGGVVVNARAKVGSAVILNTASSVDHDCKLEDGVHISPGANIVGGVKVGVCSWIGAGAVTIHSISIGKSVVVGAGAAVVHDIGDEMIVVGVPARPIRDRAQKRG